MRDDGEAHPQRQGRGESPHGPHLPEAKLPMPKDGPRGVKNRGFAKRLGFALTGIGTVLRRERSFRSQALIGFGSILAAAALRAPPIWWALLALSIGLVLALEGANAALEYALDRLHPALHPEIGRAKDAAAGAVLIAALAAAAVGAAMLLACA